MTTINREDWNKIAFLKKEGRIELVEDIANELGVSMMRVLEEAGARNGRSDRPNMGQVVKVLRWRRSLNVEVFRAEAAVAKPLPWEHDHDDGTDVSIEQLPSRIPDPLPAAKRKAEAFALRKRGLGPMAIAVRTNSSYKEVRDWFALRFDGHGEAIVPGGWLP